MSTRKVLTVNQVFEIMVKWLEEGDWETAILTVMPQRKLKEVKQKLTAGQEESAGDKEIEGDSVEEGGAAEAAEGNAQSCSQNDATAL